MDLHGRIGVASGDVVSGVLGRLQPRFCVFGEAMSQAAVLEATGARDSVHCSADFLDYLNGRNTAESRRMGCFSAEIGADLNVDTTSTREY